MNFIIYRLGFRLDLECALILIIASISSVAVREYSEIDVGLLGFALVYILGLSGLFQWTVRQSAEVIINTFTQFNCFQRLIIPIPTPFYYFRLKRK